MSAVEMGNVAPWRSELIAAEQRIAELTHQLSEAREAGDRDRRDAELLSLILGYIRDFDATKAFELIAAAVNAAIAAAKKEG